MTRVLVTDDDPYIRELVRLYLEREGFEVHEAIGGEEALAAFAELTADLAIIDIMMPGMDGWQLCRELRAMGDVPVLMLTAKGETREKVKGFGLGADDYLVKPFEPPELVARVKALLKRYHIAASKTVQVGALELNRTSYEVTAEGERFTLPRKEFELLFHLGSYPGRTLSREHLIEQLWGYDYEGDERTVDVHVKRLRDRFGERYGFRIRTIRGLGYRLEVTG
jgi:DNA-binding response OmpR family regulator